MKQRSLNQPMRPPQTMIGAKLGPDTHGTIAVGIIGDIFQHARG